MSRDFYPDFNLSTHIPYTGGVSVPVCRVSGKSLLFLGNISIFGDSGKRMKLWDEDKILGRNEKYIICVGKLNANPGKQC